MIELVATYALWMFGAFTLGLVVSGAFLSLVRLFKKRGDSP